jgi:hypothetical protein
MAKCPTCDQRVRTPSFFNIDAWGHLRCSHCKARLEMKPLRSFLLGPLVPPLFVLARQGRIYEDIAFVYMFGTIFLILLECGHVKLRLRKRPLAKPEVWLKFNDPSR